MIKGFPDRIKQYKVKWYMGPGNYGALLGHKVGYLAISVENPEQSTFLLFVSERLEILTVLECEDEQEAFAAVELPEDAVWIRIYRSAQQKHYNRISMLRKLGNVLSRIKLQVFFIAFVMALVSGWFPRYGDLVLLFAILRDVSMLVALGGFLWIACLGCKTHKKGSKFEFLITRTFFVIVLLAFMYIGMDTLLIGIDTFSGTKEICLTSTSYYREDVRNALDIDYVSGQYEGKTYNLAVTGCNHSLLYEIEETHPMVKVTLYEKSKSVVKLKIVNTTEE